MYPSHVKPACSIFTVQAARQAGGLEGQNGDQKSADAERGIGLGSVGAWNHSAACFILYHGLRTEFLHQLLPANLFIDCRKHDEAASVQLQAGIWYRRELSPRLAHQYVDGNKRAGYPNGKLRGRSTDSYCFM